MSKIYSKKGLNISMNKTYTITGLECANCAAKIEHSLRTTDGVSEVHINLLTSVLKIKFDPRLSGKINKVVQQAINKYEPEAAIADGSANNHKHKNGSLIRLISGAAVFAAALLADNVLPIELYPSMRFAFYGGAYLLLGSAVLLQALKGIARGNFFDENFLMGIATIGALAIGEYPEAVAVMLFYQVGELFQSMAVDKSKRSITELMDIRPDFANLKTKVGLIKVDPSNVHIGDFIVVKPGERIPLDGTITEGASTLDTSALTGESIPRKAEVSDTVLSGCINVTGTLTINVTKAFAESTVSKVIELVESAAGKKAKTENLITTLARFYTPVVVALAVLLAVLPPLLFNLQWQTWINRALIFLVISCPCALVLSIPMSFFSGIGKAAKNGILVKGGNYLEACNKVEIVVFDKTGTLTKGVFKVTGIFAAPCFSRETVLELAAYAEAFSNHPIAMSIAHEYGKDITLNDLSEYTEHAGYGVSVRRNGDSIAAGNKKLMDKIGVACAELEKQIADIACTKVYVAMNTTFAGCITISDEIKDDSGSAIAALKTRGVRKTIMLTGDNPDIANTVAAKIGIDEAHGSLLPHEKVTTIETLLTQKSRSGKLAFVGDGINDAPVLAMADIGIAIGGIGSDAAIEAADIVLMTDEPSKLCTAIDIARFTKKVVRQNIVFALGVKAAFLTLGSFGIASMWGAVVADVGVSLLAVLNAMRILRK